MTALLRAAPSWRVMAFSFLSALLCALALATLPSSMPGNGSPVYVAPAHPSGLTLAELPAGAIGPVSAALGSSNPAYRVAGAAARNPAQQLRATFASSGVVTVASGSRHASMRLSGIAYGDSAMRQLGPAVHRLLDGNRVTYDRPGIVESYANGPAGLEQVFTLSRAPSATNRVTLGIALLGIPAREAGAGTIALGPLDYTDLRVTDARGRLLPSHMALAGRSIQLRVDTRGARYPLRIDPLIQQGNKLTGNDATPGAEIGTSLAISADGNTIISGAIGDEGDHAETMAGAAWVFVRNGSTWTQQGPKLTGGAENGQGQFGISVALSADGNTAIVGGIEDRREVEPAVFQAFGAAWVFTRSGSTWTQQGPKLTAKEEEKGGRFGKSVALSADGNTALIGAYFDREGKGSAYAFTRSGSTWTQQGPRLVPNDESPETEGQFGLSVALSADGNTALIGGPHETLAKVPMTGAAWAFTRSGSTWTQQGGKMLGSGEEENAEVGASVALSSDGNTALLGAPGQTDTGAAFAFTRSGTTWTQQGPQLLPTDATGKAAFGTGVALSADGNEALIGGPTDEGELETPKKLNPEGAAWVFRRSAGAWSQSGAKFKGSDRVPESEFGVVDALSADGDTAALGGPIDNANTGAVWAYAEPPPAATTGAASAIGSATATLNGTIAAGGSRVSYFQYGLTTAYTQSTPPQADDFQGTATPATVGLSALVANTTYHYRLVVENSAGRSVGADETFTTILPPAPVISHAKQSHARWRIGSKLATIAKAKKKPRKPPQGTTFSFTLSESGTLQLSFTRHLSGRRVKGKCAARNSRNAHKRHCTRSVSAGTLLTLSGHKGANHIAFQGRLSRTKRLALGSYTVAITATDAFSQKSNTVRLSFTIAR